MKKTPFNFNLCTQFLSNPINNHKKLYTEEQILNTFASNPEKGIKMIMDTYQCIIYNHIRRMVISHQDAEDVMQEVFINIYRYLPHFKKESSLHTWIYKIATNESLRLIEKEKKRIKANDGESNELLLDKLMSSDYVNYEDELKIKFQKAILELPDKQRIVFNLRYYDELTYEEINGITGISVDSLKVNYHYAKDKIKSYILNN